MGPQGNGGFPPHKSVLIYLLIFILFSGSSSLLQNLRDASTLIKTPQTVEQKITGEGKDPREIPIT